MNFNYNPKLSVIIPVYNSEKYLKQCLDSVINQSYKNIEVIVVNDCSTDNSKKITEEYQKCDKRIILLNNKEHSTAGLSRNNGLKAATGDYVYYCDSDDLLSENAFENAVKILNTYGKAEIINFSYYDFYDNKKFKIKYNIPQEYLYKRFNINTNPEYFKYVHYSAWAKLIKREFLIDNNIFFNNDCCLEDLSYYHDLAQKAESVMLSDINIQYYRHRKKSLTSKHYLHLDCYLKNIEKISECSFPEEARNILLRKLYGDMFCVLMEAYGKYNISFDDIKRIIKKYVLPDILKNDSSEYAYICYQKIMVKKFPPIYFRILFTIKEYFPTFMKTYLYLKRKLFNIK